MIEKLRLEYQPKLPHELQDISKLEVVKVSGENRVGEDVKQLFPNTYAQQTVKFRGGSREAPKRALKVGVVFSGGQAAGGHNVIAGLFDAMQKIGTDSKLFGFLGGPSGIIENKSVEITESLLKKYRNMGGFDLIGSGRTKIETEEQFQKAKAAVQSHKLDGLVIIGGDDSNTNAALLAEYFLKQGVNTSIIGVPKTIDGDLKNDAIEISFGFDTATKTFSEVIGNILRDSLSAKKYYFFIKIMGRTASHVALECALQTHPNLTLIGEEILKNKQTFHDIVVEIADMICERAKLGKNYGVVVIPEGIIEFIPEFKKLISELNNLDKDTVEKSLTPESKACFNSLPEQFRNELLMDRDPHGNVQVSKIETERLFMNAVSKELAQRSDYSGKFSGQPIFCGYEGRSCYPSNFDSQYCYALGQVSALLIKEGLTGYIACVSNLTKPVKDWHISGVPLTSMIQLEERKGKRKPVIQKAFVDLDGKPFRKFALSRDKWKKGDEYLYPGPIQFFGPPELIDNLTLTLQLEKEDQKV